MLANSLTKEKKMENFFQANFVWFLVGAIILGIVIVVKVFTEKIEKRKVGTGKEFNFLISGSLLGYCSLLFFGFSAVYVVDPRNWESIRVIYLIGVGMLLVSYILHWMKGREASTSGDSSQKLKNSQENLKKDIERQKKKIKTS